MVRDDDALKVWDDEAQNYLWQGYKIIHPGFDVVGLMSNAIFIEVNNPGSIGTIELIANWLGISGNKVFWYIDEADHAAR